MRLIMLAVVLILNGCTIGVKQKTSIVYVSMTPAIEEKGLIRLARTKKIKVSTGKKFGKGRFAGYYLVHPADMRIFLSELKK